MASLRDQDSGIISETISFAIDSLPNIRFNPAFAEISTAINAIEDDIITHVDVKDWRGGMELSKDVANQYASLKKCPEHAIFFQKFDKLANNLGQGILNTFNILSNSVKPAVDVLLEDIRKEAGEIMSRNEVVDANNQIVTNFEIADWNTITEPFGGEEEILRTFKENFKFTPTLSAADIKLATGDRKFRNLGAINVDESVKKQISEMSTEQVMRTIIEGGFWVREYTGEALVAFNSGNYRDVFKFAKTVVVFKENLDKVNPAQLNVLDDVRDIIAEHITTINLYLTVVAYATMIVRDRFGKNQVIVLDKETLNGDIVKDMEAAEISQEDIAKFIRIQYLAKNRMLPATGIRLQDIIDAKVSVNEQFEADAASRQMRLNKATRAATVEAMQKVLSDYLRTTDESLLPKNVDGEGFLKLHTPEIKKAMHRIDVTSDDNLENVLYTFVIDLWHKSTPVESAHRLFGEEVVKQLNVNGDIADKDADLIDVTVAAAIAADFLVNNLLIIK
jgi:hypothetical protein